VVRIQVQGDGGVGVRAISVAEVVSPGGHADALARDVMVALARSGVTATCTTADKARYGDLAVDSNLPDVRISLGGPDVNTFSAAVLAGRDVEGVGNVWVPADAPLADVWVPGADLRGLRVLPVLVVTSPDGLADAVANLLDELNYSEIYAVGPVPIDEFDDRTVAVFNRGVPSFAVDTDGTMHTSLMRSCTGWPSGTWIDPPRRTAPDGSNFQLQHWTHVFDYALASGDGDWREADIPRRSAEFGQPLIGVVANHDPTLGGLPPWGALLEIEPARSVALGALKAIGNPTARGGADHVDPAQGVVVRLVETHGRATDVSIGSGLRTVATTDRLDLLEQSIGPGSDKLRLDGYEIGTVRAQLNLPRVLAADHTELAPDAEPAQPLYARYWLHNRGPAPLGGLPAVAHLHPHQLAVEPDAPVELQLTAVSDADVQLHGKVRLVPPPGWTVDTDELPFMLPPGEFLEANVALAMPRGTVPGLYPVRAELAVTAASVPASWRQTVEDVCVVSVGATDDRVLRLVTDPGPVEVAAGQQATLGVTVANDTHGALSVEAHLITPWGTWEWMGPNIIGADVSARGTLTLEFDVAPPAWVEPGQWWALVRVGCAGDLIYSPAVEVTVR
jgi:alpha-mannosidase